VRCALVVCLAFLLSALLSAQAGPSPTTGSPPAVSAPTSKQLGDIAARLSVLSSQLLSEAEGSEIDLAELKSSLEESRSALLSCQQSLDEAAKKAQRQSLELWLWRGAAAAGVGAAIWLALGR
jgi:hypothetical protein